MPDRNPVSARSAILASIQSANGSQASLPEATAAWDQIPRTYETPNPAPAPATPLNPPPTHEAILTLLIEHLRDYDADVDRLPANQIAAHINSLLQQRNIPRVLLPPGMPQALLDQLPQAVTDENFPPSKLDTFPCVLTQATLGIAETGTLVLQNIPGQGRRAISLVPDLHICILPSADVVATVPQALHRLQPTSTLPTTFISGPSATADIEMTRIKGVHGPRFLHVLLTD